MRFPLALLLATACTVPQDDARTVAVAPDLPLGSAMATATSPSSLQRALAAATDSTRLLLAPGHYVLQPSAYTDPTCGNCQDAATPVPGTLGMVVSGHGLEIVGAHADSVFIHTGAGYGILLEDCDNCRLSGITVTGGVRDPDGQATNGAVVVRRSTATIESCSIRDNIGDSAVVAQTVVGISGVVGREGANFTLRNCQIIRNSWDGVAMYRDARAQIHDNVVDGVDKASGGRVGGGRGVGIGLTWDAQAEISGNLVARYWKGIGIFVDAQATVQWNVVEDILTWGIAYWGAGEGMAVGRIQENAIYQTGACGAMVSREEGGTEPPGFFRANAIVQTGQNERYDSGDPYCPQRPIARDKVPADFVISENLLFNNRQPEGWAMEEELAEDAFRTQVGTLAAMLAQKPALRGSAFLREFGTGR
ncbi:MAG: right-handed parallel beta-helix repeat-containing protein [Gemmatimonadota bacterium]|nr:right-handed parallel beta-helix repeat-containing protein [Gemmatimonadota bacterium]